MPITLPADPRGDQFEEAVSARIRASGYFTENRTVLDHEGRDILELDVVATPCTEEFLERWLVDAKKDTAKFADMFKIYGWRMFLNIPRGCIVYGKGLEERDKTAFAEICPKLEVHTDHFLSGVHHDLKHLEVLNPTITKDVREVVSQIGWYQMIADRLVLEEFRAVKKQHADEPIFERVRQYRRACHLAFFEPEPLARVVLLFDAFRSDTGITGAAASWQSTKDGVDAKTILGKARDTKAYPWIQHVMALENRARILIMKYGIEAGLEMERLGAQTLYYTTLLNQVGISRGFKDGFEKARESAYRTQIPYILQIYTEVFGGYLIDQKDRDMLCAIAGVPPEALDEAFALFDTFFPTQNGWHFSSKELRIMKFIPGYLRGTGSFFRNSWRKLKEYDEIAPNQHWLLSNWHNALYYILEKELKIEEKAA
jgi:hypothetical protein